MATTRSDSTAVPDAPANDRGRDLMDWFQVKSRFLVTAAVVVLVAMAGYWFYLRSRQIRTVNAERSLLTAQQSLASGNNALAQSDLQKVISRYRGTAAGTQAAMLLGQMDYEQGKFQEGINELQKVTDDAAGSQSAVQSLIGDGYAQLGKAADAAKTYERAAAATNHQNEKAYYLAKAARSYVSAGNVAEAKRLWGDLAKNEKSQAVAAEARVRLAELNAKPAGKS